MWAVLLYVGVFFLAWLSDRMQYPDNHKTTASGIKSDADDYREPPYYPRKELKRPLPYDPEAERLKRLMISLYQPKEDFIIYLDRKRHPETRMGIYSPFYRKITIYCCYNENLEVCIHEYAHHIVDTEIRTNSTMRNHGKEFKQTLQMLGKRYKELYGRTLNLK